MAELAPLSVWPVAQKPARVQRSGRYRPESNAHPGKMLPELARTIIGCYSEPGQLVLDPMCGIGTTLVEAVHLDRRALGVELEPRWAALAAGNVLHAETQGARGRRSRCAVTHVSSAADCSTSSAAPAR
jgi:modification methylase